MPLFGLHGRSERRARRELLRELRDLRAEHRGMDREAFTEFAERTFRERYDGIDVGRLEELIKLILKYLPIILALFVLLIACFAMPQSAQAKTSQLNMAKFPANLACGETAENGRWTPVRNIWQNRAVRPVERLRARPGRSGAGIRRRGGCG